MGALDPALQLALAGRGGRGGGRGRRWRNVQKVFRTQLNFQDILNGFPLVEIAKM